MDGTIILLSAGETSLDIAELPRPICGEATRDRETELEGARPPNFSTPAVDQVIVTFTVTYKHKDQHGNCSRPRFRNRRYCLLRMQSLESMRCDIQLTPSDRVALAWWLSSATAVAPAL